MTDLLEQKLNAIYDANQPDEEFAEQLEQQLKMMHRQPVSSSGPVHTHKLALVRRLTTAAASLLIMIALFATVTPFRSLAEDIFNGLFPRADDNVITVTHTASMDPETAALTSYLTIEEVRTLANFEVKLPTYPLQEYQFIGASYTPRRNVVSLVYERPGRVLMISQQPLEDSEQGLLTAGSIGIGADAIVSEIEIGVSNGEIVHGMWIVTDTSTDSTSGTTTSEMSWSPSASSRTLRWIQDGILYEIRALGGSEGHDFIGQEIMIDIALSME